MIVTTADRHSSPEVDDGVEQGKGKEYSHFNLDALGDCTVGQLTVPRKSRASLFPLLAPELKHATSPFEAGSWDSKLDYRSGKGVMAIPGFSPVKLVGEGAN